MLTEQQRQIVKKARDRIADPVHWCRGAYARTALGDECKVDDPQAHRFCAVGALAVEYLAAGSVFPLRDGVALAGGLVCGATSSPSSTMRTATPRYSRSSTRPLQRRADDLSHKLTAPSRRRPFFAARHPHCPTQGLKPAQPRTQRRRFFAHPQMLARLSTESSAPRRNHIFSVAFSHQTRAQPLPRSPSALVQESAGSSQCAFSICVCVRNEEPASLNAPLPVEATSATLRKADVGA